MNKTERSYSSGFVQSRDIARVIGQFDLLMQIGTGASLSQKWTRGAPKPWSVQPVDFTANRIWAYATPTEKVFLMGPAGEVLITTDTGSTQETIEPGKEGPERYGDLMDLRHIGKHLYACGMSRQVYRREKANHWVHSDQGILVKPNTKSVKGFLSLDGLSENEFYAVGFGGEMFQCKKDTWRPLDSPTNLALNKIRIINPELGFVCGQKGLLLRGAGTRWEAVKHKGPTEELLDLEWFQEQLYVASADGLYRLEKNDALKPVKTKLKNTSYGHLHAADGVLWSFGTKHLCYTEDGVAWRDATPT